MTLQQRIDAFATLGKIFEALGKNDKNLLPKKYHTLFDAFNEIVKTEYLRNGWFIERFVRYQLNALAKAIEKQKLEKWTEPYERKINTLTPKKVGVVFAGNVPLVGFTDLLAVLISGHKLIAKVSSKDKTLPKAVRETLIAINPAFKELFFVTEDKLSDYEAVIATGSNNTSRYFEYYFKHVPNIIRKNRISVAVLNGNETAKDLDGLADDILLYFGLGCRNVAKIFVPKNFNFDLIFKQLYKYAFVLDNPKYENNYVYNRAIYLINREKFLENGFFIIKEDVNFASPVSVLFYEYYDDLDVIKKYLTANAEKIQCIVSKHSFEDFQTADFGKAQQPELTDYPDNINTLDFLTNL